MIVFVVPVKSKQLSRISWDLSSKILERCLKSLCNQTSTQFRVLVVHHEEPIISFSHPNIEYIKVDFPIPSWEEPSSPYRDKGRKIWVALNNARQFAPSHVMFVDSDDCVNRNLVSFVTQNIDQNGWYIPNGYEYPDGSGRVYYRKDKFHLKCGTSHIIRWDVLAPFADMKFDDVSDKFLWHQDLVKLMSEKGYPLSPLPFEGAVYISDTGENHVNLTNLFVDRFSSNTLDLSLFYARRKYKSMWSKPLTDTIKELFSVYDI